MPDKEELFASASLCVVGNLNRDVKTAPLPAGPHVFDDGETSVDWVVETIGGGGANSAAAAAALGARVGFLAKVGDDRLATRLEQALARHGVTTILRRDSACATGTSVGLAFTNGHRHFFSALPNNESLTLEDLQLERLADYRHLYRADVWFSDSMLRSGNETLLRTARQRGLATSLDLNWDPKWGCAPAGAVRQRKELVRRVLPWVTLAHGNVRELNEFAESGDLMESLGRICQWGAEAVVVHLGSQGAGYYHRGELIQQPPGAADRVVNTTGTGDVLSVCMMLLHDRQELPIAERLRLSNGVVAEFIAGRRRLIPDLDER
jgi:ribokinase